MAIVNGTNFGDRIDFADNVTNDGDVINGFGGNDIIFAAGGDDLILGGTGADTIYGGDGIDMASYIDSVTGVTVSLSSGKGQGGTAQGDRLFEIENVSGSNFDDDLTGDGGANRLYGRDGVDYLFGGDGGDILSGGNDNDVLLGEVGDDTLNGGADFDCMIGGTGRDTMTGGDGMDGFFYYSTDETGLTRETADRITDIDSFEGDWIDLDEVDANDVAAGNQTFTFIGMAEFSGTPGELRYYHFGGNTYIEMQTDNSLDVEGVIRVDGIVNLDPGWFTL